MTAKMRGSGAGIYRAITNCVLCFALQFPTGTAIAQTVPDERAGQVPDKWAGQIPDRAALTVPEKPQKFGKEFVVRISYYWPAYGGTNCYPANWIRDSQHPLGGICRSKLLGSPWSDWTGYGAACSPKIKLGDRIYIERINKVVACVDRGGAIEDLPDGTSFVDLLMPNMPWIRDWKVNIIRDVYCPRGCYTSNAWITAGSVLYQP